LQGVDHRALRNRGLIVKKIVLATALLAAGSASAFAADLPARTYTKAPMMAPINTWQGFYIGGNVGYGWGNSGTEFTGLPSTVIFNVAPTSLDTKPKGMIGGAQIGYNWQMGSLVTGLEADIQGSDMKGSATRSPVSLIDTGPLTGSFQSADQRLSWFGTVRGRLGITVTPAVLLYATGGLAYGEVKGSANTFFDEFASWPASIRETKVGWTAGAGAEWMFAHHWSAKIEYLYLDLGSISAVANQAPTPFIFQASYTWKTQQNIVRAGVNYHF
jgi:outer membrane immunogenic protein